MSQFIAFLGPPGDALNKYDSKQLHTSQPEDVPEVFCDAMSVREEVYVTEQKIPLENEFDVDDARSFHWVAYASVGTTTTEQAAEATNGGKTRKGSTANKLAIGTIRLVPPPHPPHPEAGQSMKIDNNRPLSAHGGHGKEAYVKLGRLAVLPSFRGLGLARLLVEAALTWAAQNAQAIIPPISPAAAEQRRLELGSNAELPDVWNGLCLVHAQTTVEKVWSRHGFVKDDDMGTWFEEGIEHIGMWKRIELEPQGRKKSIVG